VSEAVFKAGAVLNSGNLAKVKQAFELLTEVLDSHANSPGASKSIDDRAENAVKALTECAAAGPGSRQAVIKGLEILRDQAMKASTAPELKA
jgi:hypothetical protein